MVVKEFVRQRVAPLQRHSRPMWDLAGVEDPMRLQRPLLTAGTLSMVLKLLTGVSEPADLPGDGCLLYQCSNKAAFVGQMPLFDESGLLPEGLEGTHENPVSVAPLLLDPAACAPSVEAGGRPSPAAIEDPSGGLAPTGLRDSRDLRSGDGGPRSSG